MSEPNGLLAIGGDLSSERLLYAYAHGIFPWYSDDQPILWWSPDPRAILFPEAMRISRSLAKTLRQGRFTVTINQAFARVIEACSQPRRAQRGTWITTEMKSAYCRLHELGHAVSVECWQDAQLAGGLYGISMGQVFFGESMFSRARDASKVALASLCQRGFQIIDCQVPNAHLSTLGAESIPRRNYMDHIGGALNAPSPLSDPVAGVGAR